MSDITEKRVDTAIANAARSSKDHYKILQEACTLAMIFGAEHGQMSKMAKLYNDVSVADRDAVRLFSVNVLRKFAFEGKAENSFFTFSIARSFDLKKHDEGSTSAGHAKAMRAEIVEAGEKGLADITVGRSKAETDNAAANDFNVNKVVGDFIKRLARNGEKALALEVNRLGQFGVTVGDIDKLAADNDPVAKLAAARKEIAALEKAVAEKAVRDQEAAPVEDGKQAA